MSKKISARQSLVLGAASLILLSVFVWPIWKIALEAPQYPEGIGMQIWVNNVVGEEEHDLKNINMLNHYIGMKSIEPDSIPELRVMPWIIIGLTIFGLVAAVTRNKRLLYAWTAVFLIVAIVGLVDFYMWEYDYGHDLDLETAAIQIPGMSYQPPLIGSKKLLNFTAHSWPGLAGWLAFLSLGMGIVLSLKNWKKK